MYFRDKQRPIINTTVVVLLAGVIIAFMAVLNLNNTGPEMIQRVICECEEHPDGICLLPETDDTSIVSKPAMVKLIFDM